MTCHEARTALDALLDDELGRDEGRSVRDHLAACATCARELEDRRAFSESLAGSFERALDGVESTAEERERLVQRMAAAPRRRILIPARLAAAIVVGIAVGLVTSIFLASRPTPQQLALAEKLQAQKVKEGQVQKVESEIAITLKDAARSTPAEDPENPVHQAINLSRWGIEASMAPPAKAEKSVGELLGETASEDILTRGAAKAALRRLGPDKLEDLKQASDQSKTCDRKFARSLISDLEKRARGGNAAITQISNSLNGISVSFSQFSDGRVTITVPGRMIEARDMADLLLRFPGVCEQYGIAGSDGDVTVAGRKAAVDLGSRFDLSFRTGGWDEGLLGDAYREWWKSKGRDWKEFEARWKEMESRWRRSREAAPVPPVAVDADRILKDVKALNSRQLEDVRARVEAEVKKLEERLKDVQELRDRARTLRIFAEDVRQESGKRDK